MLISKFIKYFLTIMLIFNSSYSLAFHEICHKNLSLNDNYVSNMEISKDHHICHETSKNNHANHEVKIDKDIECLDCKFCSINSQLIYQQDILRTTFSKLDLQEKIQVDEKIYSFIIKPKGPPPKIFS